MESKAINSAVKNIRFRSTFHSEYGIWRNKFKIFQLNVHKISTSQSKLDFFLLYEYSIYLSVHQGPLLMDGGKKATTNPLICLPCHYFYQDYIVIVVYLLI